MARQKREINFNLVKKLAEIQCTIKEIAHVLEIPESTLKSRPDFMEFYNKHKENGKISLRRKQWRLADTNVAMAIWLGKQYLDQREPTIPIGLATLPEFENMSDEQLVEFIRNNLQKIMDGNATKPDESNNEEPRS